MMELPYMHLKVALHWLHLYHAKNVHYTVRKLELSESGAAVHGSQSVSNISLFNLALTINPGTPTFQTLKQKPTF